MRLLLTDPGRCQLCTAVEAIHERCSDRSRRFRAKIEPLLMGPDEIDRQETPLPESADLPFREACIDGYRLLFRTGGNTLWLAAVWHTREIQ